MNIHICILLCFYNDNGCCERPEHGFIFQLLQLITIFIFCFHLVSYWIHKGLDTDSLVCKICNVIPIFRDLYLNKVVNILLFLYGSKLYTNILIVFFYIIDSRCHNKPIKKLNISLISNTPAPINISCHKPSIATARSLSNKLHIIATLYFIIFKVLYCLAWLQGLVNSFLHPYNSELM